MITFLDLLILVVLALTAASLIAMVLMFLVKNHKVRRIGLYLTAAMGIYVSCVGFSILWPNFMEQVFIAVLTLLASLAAVVLERLNKSSKKHFLAARILAAAALIMALLNTFA